MELARGISRPDDHAGVSGVTQRHSKHVCSSSQRQPSVLKAPTPLVLRLLQLPPRRLEEALKLPEHVRDGLGVPGGAAWVRALPHRLP